MGMDSGQVVSVLGAASPGVGAAARASVLLVDDDDGVLVAFERALSSAGYAVDVARTGTEALRCIEGASYDVVVSDIVMPGMAGDELLLAIRERGLEMPVLLMTGSATLETAIRAVKGSAFTYLTKPLDSDELVAETDRAVAQGVAASQRRLAAEKLAQARAVEREVQEDFAAALAALKIVFQPVVEGSGAVYGYEALLRTGYQKLANPMLFLGAAEKAGGLTMLGRAVRDAAAEAMLPDPSRGVLFVNLHATDLLDENLYDVHAPLSTLAARVVLEITERASIEGIKDLESRIARLRDLGFRIAVDDLGAGYAGLSTLAQLRPEVIKLDMSLTRDIDQEPTKQRLVSSLVPIAEHLGAQVVAEGVETSAERDVLIRAGCQLLQGYYFARPGPAFPEVRAGA